MGILRVYLALCVIASHAGSVFPWQMHDGKQAVQIFYIISGFYMAMVLSSRYAKPRDFYVSRVMRIFPPYWIVLVGTLAISAATGLLFHRWLLLEAYANHPASHNGTGGVLLAAFSNLTVVGQDWVMFLRSDAGGSIQGTADFTRDANPLWSYLLVPQCWSVGVELTFYAFAPYLNRLRSRWLLLVALVALAARLFAYGRLGLAHDPWDYRFFPFEITLFLSGMLGYRLYARTASYHPSRRFQCVSGSSYVLGIAVLLSMLYAHIRIVDRLDQLVGHELSMVMMYPFWALGVPVLFFVSRNQKTDRIIGELSYPVYLVHVVVVALVALPLYHFALGWATGATSAMISVAVAAVFYLAVIAPLDRARHTLTSAGPPARPGPLIP